MSLTPLSEEQREIQRLARTFATEEIGPHAEQWDRAACFDLSVARKMGELGFLGMLIPDEFDGLGLDTTSYLLALEEIATDFAAINVRVSASTELISGLGAPAFTAMPMRDRTRSTRLPATTKPLVIKSSSAGAARMTTSADS